MRRALTLFAVTLAVASCKRPDSSQQVVPEPAAAAGQQPAAATGQVLRGKIVEKLDVPQYSYLKLGTTSGDVWTAVPRTDRKVGEEVGIKDPLAMPGFESKELGRRFDVVYFGALSTPGEAAAIPASAGERGARAASPGPAEGGGTAAAPGMPGGEAPTQASMAEQHRTASSGPRDIKVEKVAKASGPDGRSIQEVWAERQKLKGKPVAVRGTVVKAMPVMGTNFVHLRDGSGDPAKHDDDLTVTTPDEVKVGEVVTAKGTVVVDKDFGAGYSYPVLLQDAKVAKQ